MLKQIGHTNKQYMWLNKSTITMYNNSEFGEWLIEEMNRRGMTQADLSRASGLTRGAISNYTNGRVQRPDQDALVAIAKGLSLSPDLVFRKAGIFPPKPETEASFDEMLYWFEQLLPEEQEELLELGRLKVERRKRKHNNHLQQDTPTK